jgi:acyl-CoA synthetase (AMP-forming)/AMP-acid ligase II
VIAYCKQHLADYKCPKLVAFVGELPKTATGKIQKGKLVAAAPARP